MKNKFSLTTIIAAIIGAAFAAFAIGWTQRRKNTLQNANGRGFDRGRDGSNDDHELELELDHDGESHDGSAAQVGPKRRERHSKQKGMHGYHQPNIAPRVYPHRGQR